MSKIVVAGGGICGMAAALMLARDGHDVVVLDRDDAPVPDDAESSWAWERRSIAQFRLAHVMLPGGHRVLATELPDVVDRLHEAGGLELNALHLPPGQPAHDDDGRFTHLTGRRTVIEWSFATALDDEPNVEVRRGAPIAGLTTGTSRMAGVPHVTGVRLASGEEIAADLVIDATGRRSPTADWLAAIGARPPDEETVDVGFTYTGRFYRSGDGSVPEQRMGALTPCGSISLLTIPSDNGTWAATLYSASNDAPLRKARDPEVFERIWRSCPAHAHWLDGEPLGDVATMSGVVDRSRSFVIDGVPVVTGLLSIADAHACTNPSVGRGMTIGLLHTTVMRDAVRKHLADPVALALEFDVATTQAVDPWHEATRALDKARMDEIQAIIAGREVETSPEASMGAALSRIAEFDGEAARWFAEIAGAMALPMDVFSREGVFARVLELAAELPPAAPYGPDRADLLELIG